MQEWATWGVALTPIWWPFNLLLILGKLSMCVVFIGLAVLFRTVGYLFEASLD